MIRRVAQACLVLCALLLLALAIHCDGDWFGRHVFLPQQFFIPGDLRIVTGLRAAAVLAAIALLVVVRFVPRGSGATRLLMALILAVPAGELIVDWKLRRLLHPELVAAMDALTTIDPRYGMTLRSSMDRTQRMSGRDIRFITDAEGRRISGVPIDPALPSLVFTGESAMVGHGLQYEETIPALLGARLGLQAVDLASMSYRADQSWLRLKDGLPGLKRPVAVVGIFMPGLISRAFAGQRHPLARPSRSGGVDVSPPEQPALLERSGFYRMWRHLYWPDAAIAEGVASNAAVLRDEAALAKARGAACIFLVTGRTPEWMLHELFEVNGLDYVVLDLPASDLLSDGHPSPRGATRIADALEPVLRKAIANQ